MLWQTIFALNAAAYTIVSGSLSYVRDYHVPVDTCFNMTDFASSGNEYSFIYRCSEESVWKFSYTDCFDCNCTLQSSTLLGGCTNAGNIYTVSGCTDAQLNASNHNGNHNCGYVATGSTYSSSEAISIGACINYDIGTVNSYKYSCAGNSSLLYTTWTGYDCEGTARSISNLGYDTYKYTCGNDCGAHVLAYDNDETCNYEDSIYRNAGTNDDCNYIIFSDESEATAIDVCFSFRQAYYEYSRKYVCSSDKKTVYLKQYMSTTDCSKDDTAYIISEYTADNYTINCDGRTCNGKYRTYTDCGYQYKYTEAPVVWNYCQKVYQNPDSAGYNYSFNDNLYQQLTCIGGNMAVFYFTDDSCENYDTWVMYNESSAGCKYELTGCVNKNDIFLSNNAISKSSGFCMLLLFAIFNVLVNLF